MSNQIRSFNIVLQMTYHQHFMSMGANFNGTAMMNNI